MTWTIKLIGYDKYLSQARLDGFFKLYLVYPNSFFSKNKSQICYVRSVWLDVLMIVSPNKFYNTNEKWTQKRSDRSQWSPMDNLTTWGKPPPFNFFFFLTKMLLAYMTLDLWNRPRKEMNSPDLHHYADSQWIWTTYFLSFMDWFHEPSIMYCTTHFLGPTLLMSVGPTFAGERLERRGIRKGLLFLNSNYAAVGWGIPCPLPNFMSCFSPFGEFFFVLNWKVVITFFHYVETKDVQIHPRKNSKASLQFKVGLRRVIYVIPNVRNVRFDSANLLKDSFRKELFKI